jgi:hypothetical protein
VRQRARGARTGANVGVRHIVDDVRNDTSRRVGGKQILSDDPSDNPAGLFEPTPR